jgi:hypothetical protein
MPDLPLIEAAGQLGLTTEALRKRIQRGSTPGFKRDGQWFATLPEPPPPTQVTSTEASSQQADVSSHASGQEPGATSHASGQFSDAASHVAGHATAENGSAASPDAAAAAGEIRRLEELVVVLREELAERRREFHEEQEARRREVQQLHTLLAQAQQRALPVPDQWEPEAVGASINGTSAGEPVAAGVAVSARPWWRFWG